MFFYDVWLGVRTYGGVQGQGKGKITYDACHDIFDMSGDADLELYVGVEVGGKASAGVRFGKGKKRQAEAFATGTGRVTGHYRPTLKCTYETCRLSGPYSLSGDIFAEVGAGLLGFKYSRRIVIYSGDELAIDDDLRITFQNPLHNYLSEQ